MGSTSDLGVMEAAAKILDEFEIPFEINALSAHRTPEAVEVFAKCARARGIQVIIAAAGIAAHLPGVIAAMTTLPVIGVPINASLNRLDALLAITDASRHSRGYSSCEWRPECRYSGSSNNGGWR